MDESSGVRAPWNVWPHNKHALLSASVPLSVLFTPFKAVSNPLRVSYAPVKCVKCGAVLSPLDPVDFATK